MTVNYKKESKFWYPGGGSKSLVEEIQRLSPDELQRELDRMLVQIRDRLGETPERPCDEKMQQLMSCLRKNPQSSCLCFDHMDQYRNCVDLATQQLIDQRALEEEASPKVEPKPSILGSPPLPQIRVHVWWQPWTWLR